MKIAINTACLDSDSRFRGIGFYTERLMVELNNIPSIQLIKFKTKIPAAADLVHFPAFNPFWLSVPFFLRQPWLVTVHDLVPLKFPQAYLPGLKGWWRWQIQRFLLKKAAAIITDSEASRKDIINYTGISAEKIKVIYLAPDKEFKPSHTKSSYALPDKFVLYVGDVNYNKNLPSLIKTCLKLNFPLVLVGRQILSQDFDHQHPENQSLVATQELISLNPDKILALGFVATKELVKLYTQATLYAQVSLAEGFGLPVLEAMACGCPVLTSRSGSLSEIGGGADLKFSLENMKRCWESSTLRLKMSQAGLKQAAKFSWQKTARQTVSVYEKILNQ